MSAYQEQACYEHASILKSKFDPATNVFTQVIYENERYGMSGFSSKGLISLSDPLPFSSDEGGGWKKMSEVNAESACSGWKWLGEDWQVDPSGWMYNSSFGSYTDAASGDRTKGMSHFVRRRSLTRARVFDASLINHGCFTCDFCDFQEVESLANHFIFVLTTVSLSKYSASDFTVAKAIKLKNRLIDDLDLKGKNSFDYSLVTVQNKLAPLEREKSHKLLSVSSTSTAAEFEERKTLWLETFCTMHELYELAKLVIRKNDDSRFQHHCSQVACGQTPDSTCPWLYVTCTNPDCGKLVSRCRLEMHDNECPHKVVPCSNGCGFGVQRCLLPQHLSDQCGERIVACPYKTSLECEFVMKAKDVDSHVNENISHHFNLSMTKLGVMDATITQLNHEKMMMSAELNNLQNQLMAARRYSSNHHHGPP